STRDSGPTSHAVSTASSIAASRVPPSPDGMEASEGAIAISVKPAAVRMRATRPPVAERELAGRFGIGRRGRRDDALDRAHRQAHPIVLGRAAPADESDPPARPERASHMGERPCRIVEEHHPETREQDVVLYFPFSETTPFVRRRCLKLGPNCDPESIYAWTQSAG